MACCASAVLRDGAPDRGRARARGRAGLQQLLAEAHGPFPRQGHRVRTPALTRPQGWRGIGVGSKALTGISVKHYCWVNLRTLGQPCEFYLNADSVASHFVPSLSLQSRWRAVGCADASAAPQRGARVDGRQGRGRRGAAAAARALGGLARTQPRAAVERHSAAAWCISLDIGGSPYNIYQAASG
jgi:hypothetical protein